jgi:hypothetical protein
MGEVGDLPFGPYFEDMLDAESDLSHLADPVARWGDDADVIEEWFAAGECLDYDELELAGEFDEEQSQPWARVWGWVRSLPVRPPRRGAERKA